MSFCSFYWRGIDSSGRAGLFRPSQTVAYIEVDLPKAPLTVKLPVKIAVEDETVIEEEKISRYKTFETCSSSVGPFLAVKRFVDQCQRRYHRKKHLKAYLNCHKLSHALLSSTHGQTKQ